MHGSPIQLYYTIGFAYLWAILLSLAKLYPLVVVAV